MQGGRGHWSVYYTSPQSFIIKVSYSLAYQLWGLKRILIGWFIELSVQTLQPLIVILCIIIGHLHQFFDHCFIPLDL